MQVLSMTMSKVWAAPGSQTSGFFSRQLTMGCKVRMLGLVSTSVDISTFHASQVDDSLVHSSVDIFLSKILNLKCHVSSALILEMVELAK